MEKEKWVHPKTIVGPPAEGDRYIRRPYLNEEFWQEIIKGCHIHFTAPRRVGKTSVMKDLATDTTRGFICIYENVESDDSKQKFYKRLFYILVRCLDSVSKTGKLAKTWFKTVKIESISIDGEINFGTKEIDYKNELLNLISKLSELKQKIVLFIDEFPEVLKMIRSREGEDSAIDVLHTLREIRQDKTFNNCRLVVAGSVGLDYVVESLGRRAWINDLHPVRIGPLTYNEAKELISLLTNGASMEIKQEEIDYFLIKVKYLLPFYLQLLIEETDRILYIENRPLLTKADIDLAFSNVIRINKEFIDWEDRLKPPYLEKNAFKFCRDILTYVAHKGKASLMEIFNLAIKFKIRDDYMNLLKMLMHDGYLIESEGQYQFLSPLLQEWWKQQHPLFEIE